MKEHKILVIGACGQIGTELVPALEKRYGAKNIIPADIFPAMPAMPNYRQLDALDEDAIRRTVKEEGITQLYLLAAMLSAKGEQQIDLAWKLNVHSLLSILKIAHEEKLDKIFWPSSIAVFGPGSPKYNCHQHARTEPSTVYGISKRAGEYWCQYYFDKFGVDVRSLRYPGLISAGALPGGGTTDYAVDIFHQALEQGAYTCYLCEDVCLPMMYMPDAIRATLELMEAPKESISVRTSYNLAALSFAPCDLAAQIKRLLPGFKANYHPDYRNAIADGWPASIKDTEARRDWNWQPEYDLKRMTIDMVERLSVAKNLPLPEKEVQAVAYPDFMQEV